MAIRSIICLPTYNERDNLSSLIEQILDTVDINILIIDDDSPDGTGKAADIIAKREPRVSVMHRASRDGIGSAYRAGFTQALEEGFDQIIQMDADFSHQPRYLLPMLNSLKSTDVVVGSRYVEGGGIDNWGDGRRLVSRASNTYAGTILGLPYRDITSGFVAWKRHVLEAVEVDTITADGYAFQVELKYRAHRLGFSIVEIPIHFWDRVMGRSKLARKSIAEAAFSVVRMRLKGGT